MSADWSPRSDVRILIVNADDYGLTPGVWEGILQAHARGIVTSTSIRAVAPAFGRWIGRLRDSSLPAGVHLCSVSEDPPLLSAREVPTLVDRWGRFPRSWREFVRGAALGRVDPADLHREFSAQIDAVTREGIRPTHVDTHQQLHLWPSVSQVVTALAQDRQIAVVRVVRSRSLRPTSLAVRSLARRAAAEVRRASLVVADHAAGLDEAAALDGPRLRATIAHLGRVGGHADVATHPGVDPDPERARYEWGYRWADELEAMCSPEMRELVRVAGFQLGSCADLAASR